MRLLAQIPRVLLKVFDVDHGQKRNIKHTQNVNTAYPQAISEAPGSPESRITSSITGYLETVA